MKKTFLFIIINLFLLISTKAQIVLNEIQAENASTIYDDVDSTNSDWIELYNNGSTSVNLQGYGLTDNTTLFKWVFPSIDFPPQKHLLVFASGNNINTYMNHWEVGVSANDTWAYKVATSSTTSIWNTSSFNPDTDTSWKQKTGPIGHGYSADSTTIPQCNTLFMRRTFNVSASSMADIIKAALVIDYDDGFIAYLNGFEIARANITGTPTYNLTADGTHLPAYITGDLPANFIIDSVTLFSHLLIGDNILAIEVHNVSSTDNTLFAMPYLAFGIHDFQTFFSPVPSWFYLQNKYLHTNFKLSDNETVSLTAPGQTTALDQINIGYLFTDASIAHIPDGNSEWCYTENPTPNSDNPSNGCGTGFTAKPQASLHAGFYTSIQHDTLKCASSNTAIYYTLNGNVPKTTDKLYTGSITINSTTILRARAFSTGNGTLLPGQTFTATYFFNEPSTLPIVSLSTDSMSLWDWNTGIYVMGPHADTINPPNYGANFWQNWNKPAHAEYFIKPSDSNIFSLDAFISINGNWSRALDQKSFGVETKSSLDTNTIKYQIFDNKNIINFKRLVVRDAGTDNLFCHFRDELLQKMFSSTNIGWEASRPCNLFLNGKYWGLYHLIEKSDKYYLQENYGVNPDSVDLIKVNYAEDGNMNAFNSLVSTFNSISDFSTNANYAIFKSLWNMDNFMDYYIDEICIENMDWITKRYYNNIPGYLYWVTNVKLWREQKPNAIWRYEMHDVDQGAKPFSMINGGGPVHVNFLSQAISPGGNINNNIYSVMLRKLLQNADFKNKFINRYADILNTTFLPSRTTLMADSLKNIMEPEMQREITRWATPTSYTKSMNDWHNNITDFKTFLSQRPDSARTEILTYFNLLGNVTITVDVANKSQGKIQISTLTLDTASLPWHGIYFHGNNVPIIPIPNPGYVFDYWEPNHVFSSNNYTATQNINFAQSDTMRAHFKVAPSLTVSEINYHSDPTRDTKDWIELHNYGTTALNLSGWKIYKPATGETYTMPTGTIISANGYMVFCEDTMSFKYKYTYTISNKKGNLNFGFNDYGEEIQIQNSQGGIILDFNYSSDSTIWPGCAAGYGRTLELQSNTLYINDPTNWKCGCMLGSPGAAHSSCPETLLFNEINFNSAPTATGYNTEDWVELHNKSNSSMDISNWVFKDNDDTHSFIIPSGIIIPANDYFLLIKDSVKFSTVWPLITNIVGDFTFGLSSSGDALRIYSSDGKIYQSMVFKPNWGRYSPYADGTGYTLEFDNSAVNENPNDSANWYIGCQYGSPGYAHIVPCPIPGSMATGIKEFSTTENYKVYPTPATNQINVEWNTIHDNEMYFQLYDLEGRLLNEVSIKGKTKITLNRNGLQSGIYIYRILNNQTITGAGKIIFE